MQVSTPGEHAPVLLPQEPMVGTPSSVAPSQSSSRPSQVSGPGLVPPVQTSAPPMQVRVPGEHSPMLEPQAPPPPGLPSSVVPSQSLSRVSQSSADGPVAPEQEPNMPAVQTWEPGRHSPTPLPHERLNPSTTPSQSLSRLSQTSGDGPIPLHAPHAPAEQVSVPVVHTPVLVPQGRVRLSSTAMSQSLSRPSQSSGPGTQPMHTPPSSMIPSQSSSLALQVSVGAAPQVPQALSRPSSTEPLQLSSMPSQTVSPGSVQRVGGGGVPPGRSQYSVYPSSIAMSQSSSTPLQVS